MLGVLEKEKRDNKCSDKKSNDKKVIEIML